MAEENKEQSRLNQFTKATDNMVAYDPIINSKWSYDYFERLTKIYDPKEILEVVLSSDNLLRKRQVSRYFFKVNGYYKQQIMYYSNLLKYAHLLIPNPANGKSLSTSHIAKRYYNALDFVESISLPTVWAHCAQQVLINGVYFGIRADSLNSKAFILIDIPAEFCRSICKDKNGINIVDFNLAYFNEFSESTEREMVLKAFPEIIQLAYQGWINGKGGLQWFRIPTDYAVYFSIGDNTPFFLPSIPSILAYQGTLDTQTKKLDEETKKIVVNHIPSLNDGRLVFEPDEAAEMHRGAVKMLKNGNDNIRVFTTYGDVSCIDSKTANTDDDKVLDRFEKNIFSSCGISSEIFGATGSGTLATSVNKDLSIMMNLANKFAAYMTNLVNRKFGNSNITFSYEILPVSYYNAKDYIDSAFKLVSSGYSFLAPVVGLGISQKNIVGLKELENDLLKLPESLLPIGNSYTSNSSKLGQKTNESPTEGEAGGVSKAPEERAEQTEKNLDSAK